MNDTKKNNIDVEAYHKKDTYSDEEKKIIMDNLNEERRIHEQAIRGLDGRQACYDENEKNKILNQINEERLTKQKRAAIEKKRTQNKEVYKFGPKKLYKFLQMEREYYIEIAECARLSSRPTIVTLYYRTFDELKKKDMLIKTEIYSDKFFISHDAIRVYYKAYALEDTRKK